MNSNSIPVITAKNLAIAYNGRTIWSDANFTIAKGTFTGVLGPNGGGKTTLFRLLLGLSQPTNGQLKVLGETPHRGNPRVGYVPQRHLIDEENTIEALELVRIGLKGNHWGVSLNAKKERLMAMEALDLVSATELAHKPLGKLSGGELQRIFLAEALVAKPDLLLLDEPLANLDIKREANLVQLASDIVKKQGVTVLLIAHNVNSLLPVLDSVMYIAEGKIATGAPDEIITSEGLSKLYGTPVEVLRDSHGRVAILGIDEGAHHHV
jgi:zinc/manganese transport system ATP-binding protein